MKTRIASKLLVLCILLVGLSSVAYADVISTSNTNTFHLTCLGSTTCTSVTYSGGALLLLNSALPNFAIWRAPASDSGLHSPVLWLAAFVPSQNSTLSFSFQDGANAAVAASLFSSTAWTSGFLYNYLGSQFQQVGGPAAPIDAFLGGSSTISPGTTGYSVYMASMGAFSFLNCGSTTPCGNFTIQGIAGLPAGTIVYAFSKNGAIFTTGGGKHQVTWQIGVAVEDATAPTSSLITPPPPPIPEPSSLLLFGSGLVAVAGVIRRRLSQ